MCVLMLYCLPVLLLLKLLQTVISAQHLQRLVLHGMLPMLVGGSGVDILARTSKSLRFRGRRYATRGGLGMALLSRSEVSTHIELLMASLIMMIAHPLLYYQLSSIIYIMQCP